MQLSARVVVLGSLIAVAAAGLGLWTKHSGKSVAPAGTAGAVTPRSSAAPSAPSTIQASGEILGITIGSPIEEARKKLDPLQVPRTDAPDQKEKLGRRIYWKLNGTEYDWIMVWANAEGKVTRVRALFRPEHQRPFTEIGDVSQALTADTAIVRWNLLRPDGSPYRLTAQGAEGRAVSVYMFSQEVPSREQQHDAEPDLEEKSQLE